MLFWVLWASLAASIKNENKIVENLTWMPISRQKNISLIPALAFENLRCFGFVWQCQSTLRKQKKKKILRSIYCYYGCQSTHKKYQVCTSTLFWDIFLNHHFEMLSATLSILTMSIWNTWIWLCLFETPEQIYYSHGYLTIFKKLTLCLYSLTYCKVIILKYFFHTQTYLNKHKLNIGINLCFNKSPATPKINFIPKIILNWASKKPGIWLFGNILGHNLNQELSHAWD